MVGRRTLPALRWRAHNRFRLLADGHQFFPAMLRAIGRARHFVLLELYLFESGTIANRFIAELTAAARRGVQVRVMIDAVGSFALSAADRDALRHAGISLHVFNPLQLVGDRLRNLMRDHRKLLVVDDEVAFVGGAGITDDFSPEARPQTWWRETMLEIHGEVVHDWSRLFERLWVEAGNPAFRVPARRAAVDGAPAGQSGRVAVAHGPTVQDVQRHALAAMSRAQSRIWLATPYFIPSLRLRLTLLRAARRGVDVRLLLPGPATDHPLLRYGSRHYYTRLLRGGIRIYEYQPRFIHSKTLLVDDWVSIGSCNFDRWNLRWNLEANQEVRDAPFAAEVAAMLGNDLAQSEEISPQAWSQRLPALRRAESALASAGETLEKLLERLR